MSGRNLITPLPKFTFLGELIPSRALGFIHTHHYKTQSQEKAFKKFLLFGSIIDTWSKFSRTLCKKGGFISLSLLKDHTNFVGLWVFPNLFSARPPLSTTFPPFYNGFFNHCFSNFWRQRRRRGLIWEHGIKMERGSKKFPLVLHVRTNT